MAYKLAAYVAPDVEGCGFLKAGSLLGIKSVFGSVVAVAFQITFHAEMHVNDVFIFFKKSFLTSAHQNDPKSTNNTQF